MSDEDASSSTSCDKSAFDENPTRDALAEGLMSFLKPRVDSLYNVIDVVKANQANLKTELDAAYADLDGIFGEEDHLSQRVQKYADKISEMRHQMTVIENVLQCAHNRLENVTTKMRNIQKARPAHFDQFENPNSKPGSNSN